jgi:Tripartite tricarboxylate transporter TctB family
MLILLGETKLQRIQKNKRQLCAGAIILLFGAISVSQGLRLGTGSLTAMGPGFIPVTVGIILLLLGVVIALARPRADEEVEARLGRLEWRGRASILLGGASFIVLAKYAGMIPASLTCIFISAIGDRTATFKGAAALAVGVTAFGVLLFYYILAVPMPLFVWWQ